MEEGMGGLWALATVLGPLILLIVIVYALVRRRRLKATERIAQKEATERAYKAPEEIH